MIELVIVFLLVAGAKKAWDDTKAAWGKSRQAYTTSAGRRYPDASPRRRAVQTALRHDLGYGLSQLLHGFPQARHGFAQGWHEGRQAHVKARTGRERARAEHAEARAGALGDIRELRRRRAEALEEIRRSRRGEGSDGTPGEASPEEEPEPRSLCWSCFAPEGEEHAPYCATREPLFAGDTDGPTYSYGLEDAAHHWPAANREQAEYQAQAASRDGRTHVVLEYPPGGGRGQVVATYRNGEQVPAPDASPGSSEAGTEEHVTPPQEAEQGQGSPPEEGTTMSDTTYDGVIARMSSAIGAAEQRGAEVNAAQVTAEDQAQEAEAAKTWANQTADEMQALDVDPATLGAMADHLDAADAAAKAHQHVQEALEAARSAQVRVMETAQEVDGALKRGHAGLAQAHQDAPVEAADKAFYQG